jgi:uncharacterized membrane-anchored protein
MKIRDLILLLGTIAVLATVNVLIFQKEDLAANGQTVFLELGVVDPRSLMQGDYMRLRYRISQQADIQDGAGDGLMVIALDANRVAHFARSYNPQTPLAQNERLLAYRQRAYDVFIGPESFFFQEGQASYYNGARYAELRVSPSGEVLLVGLRGSTLQPLGPPKGSASTH